VSGLPDTCQKAAGKYTISNGTRTVCRMNRRMYLITALAATGAAALVPGATALAHTPATGIAHARCSPTQPGTDFYEAGRVASTPIAVPRSPCTTISVSHIRDARDRTDNCQTFLVAVLSADGSDPTYTEPVQACSTTLRQRTVLATDVPDGTRFRVLYQVDYLEPAPQIVRYTVWR
jgi:hypothetical protein